MIPNNTVSTHDESLIIDRVNSESMTTKEFILNCLAVTLTFMNFLAFLISRNNVWANNPGRAWLNASATEFRNYPASEFERTLSCYGLGQCQRIGGALIFQPLIFLTENLSKIYFWQVRDTERIFVIQMVSLLWRLTCVLLLCYLVFKVLKNIFATLFFINALFLTLSGMFLYYLSEFALKLPISFSEETRGRAILAFQDFPFENLQWYDFGLFAAVAIVPFLIRNEQIQSSLLRTFFLSLILTSFFEYLGFVFGVGLILYERHTASTPSGVGKYLRQFAVAIAGSLTWLSFVAFYHRGAMTLYPKFFNASEERESVTEHIKGVFWAIQNPIENLTNNPSIPFQILLVAIQVTALALFFGFISKRIFKSSVNLLLLAAIRMTLLATIFVIVFNFFVAYGIQIQAGEHGRQTFGLQIVLFTFVFLRSLLPKRATSAAKFN